MQIKTILSTDGGAHSPDKLAAATAGLISDLIEIAPSAPSGTTIAKASFEVEVMKIMLKAHNDAQQYERTGLHSEGDPRLSKEMTVKQFVDPALAAVVAATKGTMFEQHFALPEVQQVVRQTIASDLATTMHTERSWHVDGKHLSKTTGKHEPRRGHDANNPHRQAWLQTHRPEEAAPAATS